MLDLWKDPGAHSYFLEKVLSFIISRILVLMISATWCHVHEYVTLCGERDFAYVIKVTNQLTL